MTSRNPHSDNSRPGPSWGQTDRKQQVPLHFFAPLESERSFDDPKFRRDQFRKLNPLNPVTERAREEEIGKMVAYFEVGKKVKKREDMKDVFEHLRAPFPYVKKKEIVEKKIKKEIEEDDQPMVTMKKEEEWTEMKGVIKFVDGKEVKKEIKVEHLKEVKKEVERNEYVRAKYYHHTHYLISPKKDSKYPTGPNPHELPENGYYLRLYKVVYDHNLTTNPKTKDFVRRFNGKCGDKYKQLDYPQAPVDPRSKFRKVDKPKDLPIPSFTVDDQYTGIPPKREVTISNLNDNVNQEFLKKMARNHKLEPKEVHIFHHPETKKHLGMGLILFDKSKEARAFVDACDGSSVMGLAISCILDPFAATLAAMHMKLTSKPLSPLSYLSGMSEHELSLRREKITGSAEAAAAPVEGVPAAVEEKAVKRESRSLSPMDTSNSPGYEAHPPPPPNDAPHPQQIYFDDAGTSAYKVVSPPPPYSELPPSNHGVFEERRSDSHRRSLDPEGKPRRDKRRRASTSSSSSCSSTGEAHGSGTSSRHRKDSGVKKKREEYLTVKRYVSSERDSNGDKRILKEVKTVTYKRRTEQRTTIGGEQKKTPDSFDEEMKRRERSMSKGKRSAGEMRGKDGTGWSTPSSDSDSGRGRGRKRAKEHTDDELRPRPPSDATPSTPMHSSMSSCTATPSSASRRSGFHSAPIFDPTQPPPVIVPPVGLVLPAATSLPPRPSQHAPPPPPMMVLPPPPLPGGFIPPPEFFGIQSNAAMMCAASVLAAGLAAPLPGMPPLPPPPPSMMTPMTPMMGSQTPMMTPMYGGATPMPPAYGSPVKAAKQPPTPYKSSSAMEDAVAAASSCSSLSTLLSSPSMTSSSSSGMARPSSSSSLTAIGRSQGEKAMATPPTSEGGSTPRAATAAEKKEKANLDDRLSQLFGLKKSKKEEEVKEMKHVASAPSISSLATVEQKPKDDDDMDIDDDDDMDVASSSSGDARGSMQMTMKEIRETKESEEERKRKEEAEIRRKEQMAEEITRECLGKLMMDLQQQIVRDLQRKLEATAWQVLGEWEKKQKNEGEERKKQMIRDSLAAAAARQNSSPKKDPMEEMLAKKLMSPEGLSSGISKVFSAINIVKKKNLAADFSRDGTPMSRDSRARSTTHSRSSSRSSSSSSADFARRRREQSSQSASTADSDEDEEREETSRGGKAVRRRPNMRNIESSQEPSSDYSDESGSDSDDEREKENASPFSDEDVDVMDVSDDEQKDIKVEEMESASSPEDSRPSTSSAAAARAAEEQVVKEEEEAPPPPRVPSPPSAPPPPPLPISAADAARLAALVQAELLRQQPSMRPDGDGYDPIRYDHPYVRQLGMPVVAMRTTVQQYHHQQYRVPAVTPAAAAAARTAKAAADAAAARSLAQPLYPAAAAAVGPVVQLKPAKKKIEGERVPHALLGLLPYDEPKKKEKPPKAFLTKRTEEEERRIRDSFKCGMDAEDEKFLQMALAELQLNGARPFGIEKEIEFESRQRAFTPRELLKPAKVGRVDLYFEDKELAGIVPHSTGCARAEGFYRLSQKQKIRIMRRPEAFQDRTEVNERDEVVTRHQVQAQKEQRSMNRRLQTMVDSNPNSEFFKVNQLKYRKKMIKFARSRIHGWGLYALEPIAPDDMIVEYIGQKIRPIVADEREKAYERRGIGSSYLFRIDEDEVIDATRQGNFARFINHSCQPNCYAKVVTVDGDKRIVIYSKALIQKGDEITYDYKFPLEEDKIECLCGAPSCRGTLN